VSHHSDSFVGAWKLVPAKSTLDANHRPSEATMVFELESEGHYVMRAEGTNGVPELIVVATQADAKRRTPRSPGLMGRPLAQASWSCRRMAALSAQPTIEILAHALITQSKSAARRTSSMRTRFGACDGPRQVPWLRPPSGACGHI
jgi:hypothetical protein